MEWLIVNMHHLENPGQLLTVTHCNKYFSVGP